MENLEWFDSLTEKEKRDYLDEFTHRIDDLYFYPTIEELLNESGIKHPIKLEYYKQINEDVIKSFEKTKYGIEIVKTEYRPDCTKVENKSIKYVTNDEIEANEILNIFKENQVTPINSEEVIMDLFRKKF